MFDKILKLALAHSCSKSTTKARDETQGAMF